MNNDFWIGEDIWGEEFGWHSKNVKKGWGKNNLKRKHFSFKKSWFPHDSLHRVLCLGEKQYKNHQRFFSAYKKQVRFFWFYGNNFLRENSYRFYVRF